MRLVELIERAGSSIDDPFGENVRFNANERRKIAKAINRASRRELEETASRVGKGSCWPFAGRFWQAGDELFRAQVAEAIAKRLVDRSFRLDLKALPPPGYDAPAGRHECAVLLIDACYRNCGKNERLEYEQAQMRKVLERANATNTPVFEIVLPDYETDLMFAQLRNPGNWVRLEKRSDSVFETTDIEEELRRRGVKNLIVMGLNETACVLRSSQDAVKAGFKVFISSDIVQTNSLGEADRPLWQWYREHRRVEVKASADELPLFDKRSPPVFGCSLRRKR